MDVYVVRGDRPSVAVSFDSRGPVTVIRPGGEVSESWQLPDPGAHIPDDQARENEVTDLVEEAESIGRESGYDGAMHDATHAVSTVLDQFESKVPRAILDEIRDKIFARFDD